MRRLNESEETTEFKHSITKSTKSTLWRNQHITWNQAVLHWLANFT